MAEPDLTQLIAAASAGDSDARAKAIEIAYDDLRRIAARRLSGARQDHTLTATALVHEASLRLLSDRQLPVEGRQQFFAYAAKAMRNLLINHARDRGTQKRGGGRSRFALEEAVVACQEQREEFLALNDALDRLAELSPRKAQVVEMRYFGGLSNLEVADALSISEATVKRDWDTARTWLLQFLREDSGEGQ